MFLYEFKLSVSEPAFTSPKVIMETWKMCEICSKLTIKTTSFRGSLLFNLNRFHLLSWCFHFLLETSKCLLGYIFKSTFSLSFFFLTDLQLFSASLNFSMFSCSVNFHGLSKSWSDCLFLDFFTFKKRI